MELLLVDIRTLALVSCLGGVIMAGTMLGLFTGGTRPDGVIEWGIGGLYYGLGYLLAYLMLTLEPSIPGWLATTLVHNLIGLSHVLILLGVQRHLGRTPWNWALAVPVILLALSGFSVDWRQIHLSFAAETALMAACSGYAAFLLWRARSPGLTTCQRMAATALAMFALFLTSGTALALVSPGSLGDPLLQSAAFLGGMLFVFILTMSLVLILFSGAEMALRDIARRDSLTGLLSDYALGDISARHCARARRYKEPLSLLSMDMDNFKSVNDKFGHSGGDQALKDVAKKLTRDLRETDLAFRVNGKAFLVLMPSTGLNEAVMVAGRLRQLIAESSCYYGGHHILLTASFGVAELWPESESFAQAMGRADQALSRAKKSGGNQVCPASNAPAATRFAVS